MIKVFGIVGWSGSGKTDVTCRLINYLKKKKICVSSIKHSHHDFVIDKPGKDSFNHMKSGSNEVLIFNERKWAMISSLQQEEIPLKEVVKKFSKKTDLILLEGLKNSNVPKIEIYRSSLKKPTLFNNDKQVKAIVYDKISNGLKNIQIPKFNFNDTEKIANFILNQIKNQNE